MQTYNFQVLYVSMYIQQLKSLANNLWIPTVSPKYRENIQPGFLSTEMVFVDTGVTTAFDE